MERALGFLHPWGRSWVPRFLSVHQAGSCPETLGQSDVTVLLCEAEVLPNLKLHLWPRAWVSEVLNEGLPNSKPGHESLRKASLQFCSLTQGQILIGFWEVRVVLLPWCSAQEVRWPVPLGEVTKSFLCIYTEWHEWD